MIPVLWQTVSTLSAVVLAAVLGAAAAVKFTSLSDTADDFSALGVGRSRALPLVVAVAEAVTALALIIRPPLGAVLAAGLLVAFTAVVTWALAAERHVSCGCFGPLSREPVSSVTVLRNGVLLMLALLAGGQADLRLPDLAAAMTVSVAAMMAVVVTQAVTTGRRLGRLWSVELAGEASSRSGRNEQ